MHASLWGGGGGGVKVEIFRAASIVLWKPPFAAGLSFQKIIDIHVRGMTSS